MTTSSTPPSTTLAIGGAIVHANVSVVVPWTEFLMTGGGGGSGSGSGSGVGDFNFNVSAVALMWPNGSTPEVPWPSSSSSSFTSELDGGEERTGMYYSLAQAIVIVLLATVLSITTVVGNFMVLISFKMDKQLQTISNYFLLSLAVADFAIGLVSMPLYTVYLLLGYWPFGALLCDSWLSLDYLLSNASVLNLLIISFDRYFSVTRPLTYRARRTTRRAIFMISCAWVISLILWPPWIFAWPYIEGKRTVEKHKCYIQFLKTNLYITFGTAIAAFYIPVTVMCILYWQIWRETEKRQKDLTNLQVGQGVKKDNSKRSTSSDDVVVDADDFNKRSRSDSSVLATATLLSNTATTTAPPGGGGGGGRGGFPLVSSVSATIAHQPSSASSMAAQDSLEIETTYVPTELCLDNAGDYLKAPGRTKAARRNLADIICNTCYKYCKIDRDPPDAVDEDSTSDGGQGQGQGDDGDGGGGGADGGGGQTTPASAETPIQSGVSRCTSLTLTTKQQSPLTDVATGMIPLQDRPTPTTIATATGNGFRGVGGGGGGLSPMSMPITPTTLSDSVFTILIRLPLDNFPAEAHDNQPSIRMIADEEPAPTPMPMPRPLHLHLTSSSDVQRQHRQQRGSSEDVVVVSTVSNHFRRTGTGIGETITTTTTTTSSPPRYERTCSEGSAETMSIGAATATTTTAAAMADRHRYERGIARRASQPTSVSLMSDAVKLPLDTKLVPKSGGVGGIGGSKSGSTAATSSSSAAAAAIVRQHHHHQQQQQQQKKKKKKTQERKQDRKAAKTLSAILLAFIITWTPYNILVLVQTLAYCGDECVPNEIWDLVYYLCYINSTVNPLCYALCNASFRRTYVRILACKWHTKKRNPNRGYYN